MNRTQKTFEYKGKMYPEYIREGNAVSHIVPFAKHFCKGEGLDIGGTEEWCFPGALPINESLKYDAFNLPHSMPPIDYIFSSHCLEHLDNYIKVLEIWRDVLRIGGQLFLYLPHPEMEYWLPQNCRKHLHRFEPEEMVKLFEDLGFGDIFFSERDLYWSFAVTGVKL